MTIYKSYGVLAREKQPVYTYDLTDADGTVKGLSEAQINATLEELKAVMESAEAEEEEA